MLEKLNCYAKRLGILLITVALIAGMAGCLFPSQKLEIRTWNDLDAVRNNLGGSHILMNDLDSTTAGYEELASPTANEGFGWQPIGTEDHLFTGSLDGQGYEIRDLFIHRPGETYVGLFGAIDEGGQIEDIGVIDVDVIGEEVVGGLVGICYGTVTNSHSTGSVSGYKSAVGGLVGLSYGVVSNSYSTGSVTSGGAAGGLVGLSYGIVSNSYATGTVICSDVLVGGLVGVNEGTVTNSYSTGSVTGDMVIGGLVGANGYSGPGTVSNSYSTGSVTGHTDVGGLAGGNGYESIVSDSYATGNVDGDSSVGGLVGTNAATVSDSYSTGNVTGEADVGGLVGPHEYSVVSNSFYNYDEVLINGENIITIGALFGEDFDQWLANDKFLDVNERLSQESGYYVISDIDDFKQLLAFGQNDTLKFRLTSDLDLAAESNFYIPHLAGEFDGNGHKISNLSFNFDFISQVGLFGRLAPGAKVTQVGVESVKIIGDRKVGGLAGENDGTVSNSYVTGNVTGDREVGGLVGKNDGTVSNSYATGSVTGDNVGVGGLVGKNDDGTVSNSHSSGNVTGDHGVGGLVGWNDNGGTVSNSYSIGSVAGDYYIGGLVGWNLGTVSNSFWDIGTSGQATSAGGTGQNTTEMQDIATFSGAGWNIITVGLNETNPAYIWNIVNNVTYPFLSWQP